MKIQKIIRILMARIWMVSFVFVVSYFFAFPVFAALYGNSEYQAADPYGNAQIPCFYRAMTGARPLTPEEEALLLGNLPLKETGHYYGRLSGNSGTLVLDRVNNKSFGPLTQGLVAVNTRSRLNQIGLELALGYFYDKSSRLELEYLSNRNMTYKTSILPFILLPSVGTITSTISTNTFLFNGYYDLKIGHYDRFRPFLTIGIGPSFTSVKTTGNINIPGFPSIQRSKQYVSFAFGGGIGFRFNVFTRWNIVASIRYISLGKIFIEPIERRFLPAGTSISFQGNYYYVPISLGVIYIF